MGFVFLHKKNKTAGIIFDIVFIIINTFCGLILMRLFMQF
jgi:hypothetical protein